MGMYEHCADVLSEYVRCRYDCWCTMLCLAGTVGGWVCMNIVQMFYLSMLGVGMTVGALCCV